MFLLVLGAIGLVVALFVLRRRNPQASRIALVVSIVLIGIGFFTSFIKQVDAGEVAVKRLFGRIDETPMTEGIHIVVPFTEIFTFDTRTQNYTMAASDQGTENADVAAPIRVLTADGLEVVIDVTVLYRLEPGVTPQILRTLGPGQEYRAKIVRPIARTKIRDNAVYYDAVSLYGTKREEFQQRIEASIKEGFESRGIILEDLLIRNIDLPASVKSSIEAKIQAEQEAQKMEFVLQKEKQEAERKRVEAAGIRDYNQIISAGLTDRQLRFEMIKAQRDIATSPNTKVIIMGGGSAPIILGG